MYTYIHTYVHIHTYIHAYIRTYIHLYIYIYTGKGGSVSRYCVHPGPGGGGGGAMRPQHEECFKRLGRWEPWMAIAMNGLGYIRSHERLGLQSHEQLGLRTMATEPWTAWATEPWTAWATNHGYGAINGLGYEQLIIRAVYHIYIYIRYIYIYIPSIYYKLYNGYGAINGLEKWTAYPIYI